MKLATLANNLNHPYLVIYEQGNREKVRTFIYAPNQKVALTSAIKATPIGNLLLSVQRLYKS